ncbi:MAG: MoaD/ThiS family protein [Actinomycetota bacterium]|nr:MAG: MoaD/ThiS family protein [Actinomycetota bacterium]
MTGSAAAGAVEVTVRYWAAARDAAGVASEQIVVEGATGPPAQPATGSAGLAAGSTGPRSTDLGTVLAVVRARHPGGALDPVLRAASFLVDELPVGTASRDLAAVRVPAGACVEVLPPFAGG